MEGLFSCSSKNKERVRIMLSNFKSLLNLILIKRTAVDLTHDIAEPEGLTEFFLY